MWTTVRVIFAIVSAVGWVWAGLWFYRDWNELLKTGLARQQWMTLGFAVGVLTLAYLFAGLMREVAALKLTIKDPNKAEPIQTIRALHDMGLLSRTGVQKTVSGYSGTITSDTNAIILAQDADELGDTLERLIVMRPHIPDIMEHNSPEFQKYYHWLVNVESTYNDGLKPQLQAFDDALGRAGVDTRAYKKLYDVTAVSLNSINRLAAFLRALAKSIRKRSGLDEQQPQRSRRI